LIDLIGVIPVNYSIPEQPGNNYPMESSIPAIPYFLKQGLKYLWGAVPPSARFGRHYRRTRSFLNRSQWWSREELERYQRMELERVLRRAGEKIPYYRDLFAELGIRAGHLKDHRILMELPFLTKEMVMENYDRLIDPGVRVRSTITISTGGTSGKQLKIMTSPAHRKVEDAFIWDLWGRVGFGPGSRRAVLRGNTVRTPSHRRTWKYDPRSKELFLSVYDLDEESLGLYWEKIKLYRPEFIHCYPSAIMVLARFAARHRLKDPPPLKAVLTSSENTYPRQREFVEEILRTRYFDLYGQTEQVVLAGECEVGGSYHIYPQYGYTEIIDTEGRPVTEDGGEGEIVGTGFINTIMPLIRYRTGDWGWLNKNKCACGRNYPRLRDIQGRRAQETIVGKDGNSIPLAAVNSHSGIYDRVKQYQFVQDRQGKLVLLIVKDGGYTDRDTAAIIKELTGKLGESVDLSIEFRREIPRTKRGKFQFLIQKVGREGLAHSCQPLPVSNNRAD